MHTYRISYTELRHFLFFLAIFNGLQDFVHFFLLTFGCSWYEMYQRTIFFYATLVLYYMFFLFARYFATNALSLGLICAESRRSGLLSAVRIRDCSLLQASTLAWSPEIRIGGTLLPFQSSGLEYCGYSSSPSPKESSSADSPLCRTPGIILEMESIITMAGSSPPVRT